MLTFSFPIFSSIPSAAAEPEMRSPRAKLLWDKWRHVWMLAWDRQKRLHDHLMYLQELERVRQFSWDDWRKRVSRRRQKNLLALSHPTINSFEQNCQLVPSEKLLKICNSRLILSRQMMQLISTRASPHEVRQSGDFPH